MNEEQLEALGEEITTLAAQINAATARWLGLIDRFDQAGGWVLSGCKSCAHWVAWQCGIGAGAAREHVRVAARLRELPLVAEAFAQGALSYSKVRALTRVEEVKNEEDLLVLAEEMTASQLERAVRSYRGVVAVELGHAHARELRDLSVSYDDDGSVVVRCRLPAEEGELLVNAMDAALDELRREELGAQREAEFDERLRERERPRVGRADALLLLCDKALSGGKVRTGGDRYQAMIEIDNSTLAGEPGVAVTAAGQAIPAETARRICCDSSIVPVGPGGDGSDETDGGEAGNSRSRAGTRTRTIPASVRRALKRRDNGCRFPGCTAHRYVDAHHIQHWSRGGASRIDNLVELCRHHHTLVHEGGYKVSRDRGELCFARPDGEALPRIPRPRRACADDLAPVRPGTLRGGLGVPLENERAVDALVAHAPPVPPSAGVPAGTF